MVQVSHSVAPLITIATNTFISCVRTCKRTHDNWSEESNKLNISNWITHVENCKKIPESSSFAEWQRQAAQSEDSAVVSQASLPSGSATGQRQLMKRFVQRGIEHPHKELTRRGFRMAFVKAVLEDDLPFIAGEKSGIEQLLRYVLPANIPIPNHQMVFCDMNRLYDSAEKKLTQMLKVSTYYYTSTYFQNVLNRHLESYL